MTSQNHDATISPELKKGSLELLVLTLLAQKPRHGYEVGRLIELRSGGRLEFRVTTLYPVLYRMENRGWIHGRWVEKPGERRRCVYEVTEHGHQVLAQQRSRWRFFTDAVDLVLEASDA
jgi:transcriptional regulator